MTKENKTIFTPKKYQQKDFSVIKQLINEFPLATVVVAFVDATEACHVPLYWQDDESEYGMLCGHVAKANPIHAIHPINHQWLIIFQDMGHYISTNWYPTKLINHKAVPTWNYRSVHLQVEPTIITSDEELAQMVGKLSDIL